jgi:hypothetical protein
MAQIPEFKTVDEEVKFWESHDSTPYWEDMEEVEFEVGLHRNVFHPKLIFLTERPKQCPRCKAGLDDMVIEYVTQNNGHLLVIRDVPAFRCQSRGHEYMLEETLDQVEQLLKLENIQKLQPAETINVPVYRLRKSA